MIYFTAKASCLKSGRRGSKPGSALKFGVQEMCVSWIYSFKEQKQTKEVSLQLHFYSLSHWRKKKKLLLDIKQPASWHCPRDTDPPVSTRSCLGFAKRGCEQGDGAVQGAVPACRARGCTRPPHASQPQCRNQNCSWETGSVVPSARLLPLSKGIKLFSLS